VVRYYKGSLMLDSLRRTLGDERFFPACREFFQTYEGKPTETKDFRAFWEKKLADRKDWLDAWLNSKGGLPGSTQN
jgi:aminopeptidase N